MLSTDIRDKKISEWPTVLICIIEKSLKETGSSVLQSLMGSSN